MNNVILAPCTMREFSFVMPLLESYADVFNFQQKHLILQYATKVLEEQPQNPTLYLARHENQNIAFSGFQRDNQNPSEFLLFSIVVKRGYQGQGVGTKLFQYSLAGLQNLGASAIRAYLKTSYPPATKAFYHKLGFVQQLDETYNGFSSQDNILYVKRLKNH